jgi:hypothetical protein
MDLCSHVPSDIKLRSLLDVYPWETAVLGGDGVDRVAPVQWRRDQGWRDQRRRDQGLDVQLQRLLREKHHILQGLPDTNDTVDPLRDSAPVLTLETSLAGKLRSHKFRACSPLVKLALRSKRLAGRGVDWKEQEQKDT